MINFKSLLFFFSLGCFGSTPITIDKIATIRTVNQHAPGNSCGYWAVCNAAALTRCMEKDGTFQVKQVLTEAQYCGKYYIPARVDQLWSDEVEALAKKMGISCLVLGKYPGGEIMPLASRVAFPGVFEMKVAKYRKLLRRDEPCIIRCICNTGGHWIMVAIVKEFKQEKPYIVFMDNCNGSASAAEPFVHYLRKLLS